MELHPDLVEKLAERARLSPERAREILEALSQIDSEHHEVSAASDEPTALLARAAKHELGLPFLLEGNIEAVAITFRTHAFHVEEARRRVSSAGTAS